MKTWDVIVVGGGIVGLSLALSLRRHGAQVLIVERGEPGREASWAAAGMLAELDPHLPEVLRPLAVASSRPLAVASSRLYPEFVHELQDESGEHIDLREHGTLFFPESNASMGAIASSVADTAKLKELEPCLSYTGVAMLLRERSFDPRTLMAAALKAAKHRQIEIAAGSPAVELLAKGKTVQGVRTEKTSFRAPVVVNCAGAWAADLRPGAVPTIPVKGQMLALIAPRREMLRHVVRAPEVYLVPHSDGRILAGSTLEHVGFDKRVTPDTIQLLHQRASDMVPELGQARMLEAWAGLRPGTPDELPILGAGEFDGYFVAAGHYRDGILLAPVTAALMTQLVRGESPQFDVLPFSPARFRRP
ncbi:MAG: glycine oxidase ThiO [Terriglobales bacterium]